MPTDATHEFSCTSPPGDSDAITWLINKSVEFNHFENIVIGHQVQLTDGSRQSILTFTATAGANNTNIRCVVTNVIVLSSHLLINRTIVIQGTHTYNIT